MSLLILIFLCSILNNGVLGKSVRIVGGSDTAINEFPYLVSLRIWPGNKHFCAGSIVSESHVLTAAHCLHKIRFFSFIRVIAGANSATEVTGSVYTIERVAVHPLFTGTKTSEEMNHHDIAVVRIREVIEFNEFQNKIELPTRQDPGRSGFIAGWGLTNYPSEELSAVLQKASMDIYTDSQCADVLRFHLKDEQFCACSRVGIGPCTGDSGGPIVSDGKIIGIISFSVPCGHGIPDIYTKVYSYLNFIVSAMR